MMTLKFDSDDQTKVGINYFACSDTTKGVSLQGGGTPGAPIPSYKSLRGIHDVSGCP